MILKFPINQNQVKVTLKKTKNNYKFNSNLSFFINEFVSVGMSMEEAETLAKQDIKETLEYLKKYHNIEI